jgi:serine/threonine-protein kinase
MVDKDSELERTPAPRPAAVDEGEAVAGAFTALQTAEDTNDSETTIQSEHLLRGAEAPDLGAAALVGTVLPGQFRVTRVLGEGGFGTVYLAEQLGVGRLAVVKVVKPELVASAHLLARFDREARVLASLGHHHLVQLYVADRLPNGQPFLAMEYGGDRTLQDEIRRAGKLEPARALLIAEQICEALGEAHTHVPKVVHRDLKPANVMLAEKAGRDFVKVVDVGMARLLGPSDSLDESLITARGALVGTPAYFSPEQARGDPADERSDLYALGCILFEMLSGKLPFDARSPHQFIHAHCYEAPLPLEAVGLVVPDDVRQALYRALEKDPADRFQTAAEMRDALQAARLALSPSQSAPPSAREPAVVPPSQPKSGQGFAAQRPLPQPGAPQARPPSRAPVAPRSYALPLAGAGLLVVLLLAGAWFLRRPERANAEQDLASARDAAAQKDFRAALVFARHAGKPGSAQAARFAVEAEGQEIFERLSAALAAKDAEQARELLGRCQALTGWYCELAAGRREEVRALYAAVHLEKARALQRSGALSACAAEAGLVVAADSDNAAARSLAEACQPPPAAAAPAKPEEQRPPRAAAPQSRSGATAAQLLDEALRAASVNDLAKSSSLLLAAEARHPDPLLLQRIYKNQIAVSAKQGEVARACKYVGRYRPIAPADEQEQLARLAGRCASAASGQATPKQ